MQDWGNYRHSCYELFGFDVLLDDALNPWVLEVNLSPSLSVESNLDFGVKSRMLSDLFNITGFDVFDRMTPYEDSERMKPFSDNFDEVDLRTMAEETKREMNRSGGWNMLVPAMDDSFDRYFPSQRRPAYKYIREYIKENA